MISEEELTRRVREKLEDTDAITRLERGLTNEIVEEFREELYQKKLVIRQQIRTQIEVNEGDLERQVEEAPLNSMVLRASDRTDCEVEESKEKRRLRGGQGGFDKLYKVSRELADFIGSSQITRKELMKFMYSYFEANGLKDPEDRRYIISNRILKDLLKVDRFHSFELMKLIKPHIIK